MKERQAKVLEFHKTLSKRRRAYLLAVNLSSLYLRKKPVCQNTVDMMNALRGIYERRPFQGYRRMTLDLRDDGYFVNHKKVYRLMSLMGLQAIYPKQNLSKRRQEEAVYPYLLKQHPPQKPHDVWCVDITYIKISKGFLYLVALIDVVSRCVMGHCISTSLDTESCLQALEMALKTGYKPKIINSDQGCQFTSQEWAYALSLLGIKISMDGKGRCLDNIPIERFWRTIKYEEVYLKTYETVKEAKQGLSSYIHWYNHERRHSGINNHRPYEVMIGEKTATRWAFAQNEAAAQGKGCGCVDNPYELPTKSTATTTVKHKKGKNRMNLSSSKIAA
jgi:putative transposase